ncbi:MAG: hypothetical protein QXK76_02720 [Candidatus Woesearchaeota archaeon]
MSNYQKANISKNDSVSDTSLNSKSSNKSQKSQKDVIVAVRMPKGLVDELRDLQKVNHFMDLSDEIRYIIRKNILYVNKKPDISRKKEQIINELSSIIDELKKND